MTYKSLMVHLELNGDNEGVLKIAGDLAQKLDARVIGIAACQPLQLLAYEGIAGGEAMVIDRTEIEKELDVAAAQFHAALQTRARHIEWRSAITYGSLAEYIADQARAADLIITGKDLGAKLLDESRRVNVGDLVMRAGRPVLIVPQGVTALNLRHVVIGWKETREARRAAADALPLLQLAGQATVLAVTMQDACDRTRGQVQDVTKWLEEHDVRATADVAVMGGTDVGHLHASLVDRRCDLLVAGAYGHSRLSEWVFGGVTMDMLLDPDFCVLASH